MRRWLTAPVAALTIVIVLFAFKDTIREHRARAFARAAWNGEIGKMKLLRLLGADPQEPSYGVVRPMIGAAENGHIAVVAYLLDSGVNVNQHDKFGLTALIAVTETRHIEETRRIEMVKYLLSRGADVNAISEGYTALALALKNNNAELVQLLREHGAKK